MVQDSGQRPVEQRFQSFIAPDFVDGICQVAIIKRLSITALARSNPLDLQPQLAHIKGIRQEAGGTASEHRAAHALEKADVRLVRGRLPLLTLLIHLFQV